MAGVYSSGDVDHSLMQRFYEAFDIFDILVKDFNRESYSHVFFGYGFGATFEPIVSFSRNNILSDGTVHHLHSTPTVLLFRFGVIGAILYLALVCLLIKRGVQSSYKDKEYFVICVFLMLGLADGLFRNSMVNPWFFVGLGAFLNYRKRRVYGKA